jgi:hypothetical protein
MFNKIADNQNESSLAVKFRRKRFAFFQSLLARLDGPISILDIGGSQNFWQTMEVDGSDRISVTLLNLSNENVSLPNMTSMVGDARNLEFGNSSFDVAFSNSVIEHVGSLADQEKMAEEIRRVGKRYFVQTPNKYFPLEPHFLFPFFQFLPISVQVSLLRQFDLGWIPRTPDGARAREIVEGIHLLEKIQFQQLFPSARLYEEKVLWMTKSFIAYEGWDEYNASSS